MRLKITGQIHIRIHMNQSWKKFLRPRKMLVA
nr:MAG TPA: hypothetical protein [Caudoviricetes sp.]